MSNKNPALLEIGGVFNERYEIRRCIKAGGMGAVYEVLHLQTNRPRALKVMLPSVVSNEDLRGRFKLEATVISAVESDHIAEVLDAGVDDATGSPFILMELLKGEELGAMAARMGPMPPEDVALYLQHAAYGLEKTHEAGIVHRDLKPENLFVTYRDDGTPRVKLLDFGIAKVLGDTKTQQTRGILGTPLYISPEQVHGEQPVSGRTDVYAMAHIAYTLLTGEPYWAAEEHSAESIMPLLVTIMRGHDEKATKRAKKRRKVELPPAFDDWFDKAAAVKPEDRFAGPLALVEAFTEVFGIEIGSAKSVVRKSVIPDEVEVVAPPSPTVNATAALPEAAASESATSEAPPRRATVAAKPEDLAVAQEASMSASKAASTAAEMTRSVAEPPRARSAVPWVLVGGAVLAAGVYFGTRSLGSAESADVPPIAPASNAPSVDDAPVAAPPPDTTDTGAPSDTGAPPTPSAGPSEPSAAPSTVAGPKPAPNVRPVPRPPSPVPQPSAKPAGTGWQPLVPDR